MEWKLIVMKVLLPLHSFRDFVLVGFFKKNISQLAPLWALDEGFEGGGAAKINAVAKRVCP